MVLNSNRKGYYMAFDINGNTWENQADADKSSANVVDDYNLINSNTKQSANLYNYQAQPTGIQSYLPQGWLDGRSNNSVYNTKVDGSGDWMRSGVLSDSKINSPGQFESYDQYLASSPTSALDAKVWQESKTAQGYQDNQSFNNNVGFGLGTAQLGLGVMSYLGAQPMNKKNMQLMGTQIANNNDILATRQKRAGDISKYFGTQGPMSVPATTPILV